MKNTEYERRRYLEDHELEALRGTADEQFKAIIDFAYLTAIRGGDLIRMRLSDITEKGIFLTRGKTRRKTGKRILFELTPALSEVVGKIAPQTQSLGP